MYLYYQFASKMHYEPKDWLDLFEFNDFFNTEGIIQKSIIQFNKDKEGI